MTNLGDILNNARHAATRPRRRAGVAIVASCILVTGGSAAGWAISTKDRVDSVAVIGDSFTSVDRYSKAWPAIIGESRGLPIQNVAIGGKGYGNGGFGKIVDSVTGEPDLIIVAGSRNDVHRPDLVRAAADDVFRRLHANHPKARLVVIGPIWDSTVPAPRIVEANSELAAAAEAAGADYIDALSANWLGDPTLIAADLVHPNDAGARVLASNIDAALSKLGI